MRSLKTQEGKLQDKEKLEEASIFFFVKIRRLSFHLLLHPCVNLHCHDSSSVHFICRLLRNLMLNLAAFYSLGPKIQVTLEILGQINKKLK